MKSASVAAAAALAVLVAGVPLGSSQEMPPFTQAYQARVAQGDIPTTAFVEGAGWNLAQSLQVKHIQGAATLASFHPPSGAALLNVSCTCGLVSSTESGAMLQVQIASQTGSGTYRVDVASRVGGEGVASGMTWRLPSLQAANQVGDVSHGLLVVYTARQATPEMVVDTPLSDESVLAGANNAPWTIHFWEASASSPMPETMWVAVHPGAAAVAAEDGSSGFPWLHVVSSVLLGMIVWSFLVSRGIVQKRTRKQVAAAPVHEELAKKEPRPLLEARKRALMAALKEIELAKMNKELDDAAYDAVKAELKAETVAVMRAIEESPTG